MPNAEEEYLNDPVGGCAMLIAGRPCGKLITAEVHQTEAGHIFEE